MKTTLFTGAGASRAIGYPLTSQLMPSIKAQLIDRSLFDGFSTSKNDKKKASQLLMYLQRLLPGFDDVDGKDLPLITDVFSLVEYAIVSGEAFSVGGQDDLRS